MSRSPRSPRRTIVPLDGALGNSEIACLVEAPLIDGPAECDLVLTSDQWSALNAARRSAGRPLHFVEAPLGAEEQGGHAAGTVGYAEGSKRGQAKERGAGIIHALHGAGLLTTAVTMKRAAFQGAP